MSLIELVILSSLAVFAYMNLFFLLSQALKRNDIVDIAWGLGFVMLSLLNLVLVPDLHWRRGLILLLVITWGLRLSGYIFIRNKDKPEDFRYAQWRKEWGKNQILRSYLQVFVLQSLFMLGIAYPLVIITGASKSGFIWSDLLGIALWCLGFYFEAVGDEQMRKFKKETSNKGKIMRSGLWRYTRHPNYFGEATMWWGVFFLSLGFYNGYWAIASPIVISFTLLWISGVPMLEKKYKDNQKYQDYIRNTPTFIPFWPKKRS